MDVCVHDFVGLTAATHIYNLDSTFVLLLQQNILRLEIAMDDFKFVQEQQCLENLDANPSNKVDRKAIELVLLNEFVEVLMEQLEGNALRLAMIGTT